MDYEHSYRSSENHIFLPDWEGLEVVEMPEYYLEIPETKGEYIYEIEVGATWDDMFGELIVRKVSASDQDALFELEEEEIDAIVDAIAATNIFGARV